MHETKRNAEIAAFHASLSAAFAANVEQDLPPLASLTPRADRIRERMTPLKDRLAVVLSKIPDEIKTDGIKLDEIWGTCLGRQRSKPTAHAVAAALRELGWVRVRTYPGNDSEPAVTLWFPPLPTINVKRGKL